jgi:hypothetical protein
MAVDGDVNAVDEVEVAPVPMGPDNPYGNAFRRSATRLTTESAAARVAAPERGRVWHIVNPGQRNRFGDAPGYVLTPQGLPVLQAAEGSSIHGRATFATKHLWVTRYAEEERFPAGDLVNQCPPGQGLPAYTAGDRDIDGADIVVWHCAEEAAAALTDLIDRQAGATNVAAVIIEPIQGEGGFVVPAPGFLPRVAEICRARGNRAGHRHSRARRHSACSRRSSGTTC